MLNYSLENRQAAPTVELEQLAGWLKVLAEPNRLRIFGLLMQGVHCNCELGDALEMAPNLISHHLGVLRRAGLVAVERDAQDARWVYYSIDRAGLSALSAAVGFFFDPARVAERQPLCGPRSATIDFLDYEKGGGGDISYG